jgi:hypothetical protein
MSDPSQDRFPRLIRTVVGALVLVIGIPVTVIASHQFNDVPGSSQFHESISWLATNGITLGCNPPANDDFCPRDNVTREQMAAFMRRQAETNGSIGRQLTGLGFISIPNAAFVEILKVAVDPKAEAEVTLVAHASLEKPTSSNGTYLLRIARDNCAGTVVGAARWRSNANADGGSFEANTISFTGYDVISTDVSYVLCAAKSDPSAPNANAFERGMIATWSPTT